MKMTLSRLMELPFLIAFFVFSFSFVYADDAIDTKTHVPPLPDGVSTPEPIMVASVNIQDLELINQEDSTLTLGFNISNIEGVQPAVMYGVDLFKREESGYVLVDQKIYDNDIFNLGANESIHKEITYTAPAFLKGEYVVGVEARNPNALIFGTAQLRDKVTLDGTDTHILIDPSRCSLMVDGESEKNYTYGQMVDVVPGETLIASCSVANISSTDQVIVPTIQTRYRSAFGKIIDTQKQEPFTITANNETDLTVKLPTPSEPQEYLASLSFLDDQGVQLASSANFRFVVGGESATIQNVTLDKKSYAKGEEAKIMLFWMGSAQNFPGARFGGVRPEKIAVTLSMTDKQGQSCADVFNADLNPNHIGGVENFSLPVKIDCGEPSVTARIINKDGKALADNIYRVEDAAVAEEVKDDSSGKTNWKSKVIFIIGYGLILFFVIVLLWYLLRRNKKNGLNVLFGLLVGLGIFMGTGEASANTWTWISSDLGESLTLTVTLNKSTYAPGEDIYGLGTATNNLFNDRNPRTDFRYTINGTSETLQNRLTYTCNFISCSYNGFGDMSFFIPDAVGAPYPKAQNVTGSYNAVYEVEMCYGADVFNGTVYDYGGCLGGTVNQAYTVAPPPPTLTFSGSPLSVAAGGHTNLTWSSTNATSCTASGGWSGGKALSGSNVAQPAISTNTTYTLACRNSIGNTVTRSVTVGILAPTLTLSGSPLSFTVGGHTNLTWSAANVTSCTASGGWSGSKALSGSNVAQPAISANTTYTLTCVNAAGATIARSVTATVLRPTLTFSGSPLSVAAGGHTNLTWSATNATSCTASGGWSGAKSLSGSNVAQPAISANTTYTLTCVDSAGSTVTRSVTVTILLPTLTFSGSPTSFASGGHTNLTWSSSNATSCTASGGWSGSKALSGSNVAQPAISANTTYTLACRNSAGSTVTRSVTVTVAAPTLTFSASPTVVASGGHTNLTWSAGNVTSCTASGGWSGTKSLSGSNVAQPAISVNTNYILTCRNAFGATVTRSVTVTMAAPTLTFTASPTSIIAGGSSTLSWTTTNATSCWGWGGGIDGWKALPNGNQVVSPASTTLYSMECWNSAGISSGIRTATVTVSAAPALSFTGNGTLNPTITLGGSINLVWSGVSLNANSCTASGGWSGSGKPVPSSQSVTPGAVGTVSYVLTCMGTNGVPISRTVTATINPTVSSCVSTNLCQTGEDYTTWSGKHCDNESCWDNCGNLLGLGRSTSGCSSGEGWYEVKP